MKQQGINLEDPCTEAAAHNVISLLDWHASRIPDKTALKWVEGARGTDSSESFTYGHISYSGLAGTISRTAANLQELGIRKNDRVIIFLPMSLELYVAMFSVQRLGAIAVFLDSWARRDQLEACAQCAEPVAMISQAEAFELIKGVKAFGSLKYKITAGAGDPHHYPLQLENMMRSDIAGNGIEPVHTLTPALITFTTGSSGKPKGANRSHGFLVAQHNALKEVIPYSAEDIDLPAFPVFSLNNLASGVTTVLPALNLAAPSAGDAAILANQIINEKITCCTLSPSMFTGLGAYCQNMKIVLSGLRRVVTGGAPVSSEDVLQFRSIAPQARVLILYGSTEVEPMTHIDDVELLAAESGTDPELPEEGVNVGRISHLLDYKFIRISRENIDGSASDLSELEVPAGETGEFIVAGDHVCQDYYNNQEAFERSKIRDRNGRIWHRTGDVGFLDKNGHLRLAGRIHNVIQRRGKYYFPVRPEMLLKRFAFVKSCAFLGLPDPQLGERTAAVIVPEGKMPDESELNSLHAVFLKNKIPLDSVYIVTSVPFDPRHHSKVDYDRMREMLQFAQPVSGGTFRHIQA